MKELQRGILTSLNSRSVKKKSNIGLLNAVDNFSWQLLIKTKSFTGYITRFWKMEI